MASEHKSVIPFPSATYLSQYCSSLIVMDFHL